LCLHAEIKQCLDSMMPYQRRIDITRDISQRSQGLGKLALKQPNFPHSIACERIAGIDCHGLVQFLKRLLKQSNMSIDKRKLMVGLIQIRIQTQCATIFLNDLVFREMLGWGPEQTSLSEVGFG